MENYKRITNHATIDGDAGLGLMITAHAMNLAIEKAEKYGTGSVSIRNSEHCGAVGYFAMMALEYDMVGTCMTAGEYNGSYFWCRS